MSSLPVSTVSWPPVGVVIVNWNLRDSLRETLQSFRQVDYPDLRIVVSDNASTDGSQEMVRQEFPEVRLLAHDRGLGYARAASLGMAALLPEVKYIFSTTNDVLVAPDLIRVLVEFAEAHPEVGVAGAKIFFHSPRDRLWSAGGFFFLGHPWHHGWMRKDAPRYNRVRDCAFVTGCGFLLRSEALQKVGFFEESLVFYSEDADLCLRIREAGYRVVYFPLARMWHKTSTTLAKNRPVQLYYSTRNNLYVLQRHRIGIHPLTLWAYLALICPAKMLLFLLLGRWGNARGIWQGICDWYRGRYGWYEEHHAGDR
ncbi:glycosyltransferase family 2 protein [Limisphaera sp. VF-2]|jgi:GT2 family glycosyltransferase|uniref:glycosyltransferase family 2 protein n=1 Tax=Limisphaera sp. VF-2 TaxID=3400418 RepID=UPI00176E10BD|nr:glycosyltransferase family 2 protein [Limisphaera sp.]